MITILSTQKTAEALANPYLLAISGSGRPELYFSKPLRPGESLNEGMGRAKNRRRKKRRII